MRGQGPEPPGGVPAAAERGRPTTDANRTRVALAGRLAVAGACTGALGGGTAFAVSAAVWGAQFPDSEVTGFHYLVALVAGPVVGGVLGVAIGAVNGAAAARGTGPYRSTPGRSVGATAAWLQGFLVTGAVIAAAAVSSKSVGALPMLLTIAGTAAATALGATLVGRPVPGSPAAPAPGLGKQDLFVFVVVASVVLGVLLGAGMAVSSALTKWDLPGVLIDFAVTATGGGVLGLCAGPITAGFATEPVTARFVQRAVGTALASETIAWMLLVVVPLAVMGNKRRWAHIAAPLAVLACGAALLACLITLVARRRARAL